MELSTIANTDMGLKFTIGKAYNHPHNMVFHSKDGQEIGRLEFGDKELTFTGNSDASAMLFLDTLVSKYNKNALDYKDMKLDLKDLREQVLSLLTNPYREDTEGDRMKKGIAQAVYDRTNPERY